MTNMIFQGTVLGPILWNLFFADSQDAISSSHFSSIVYADDLNAFKSFSKDISDDAIWTELDSVQDSLHSWGHQNFVKFDASKESKHILSKRRAAGGDFRILGCLFDCSLSIAGCVHETVYR